MPRGLATLCCCAGAAISRGWGGTLLLVEPDADIGGWSGYYPQYTNTPCWVGDNTDGDPAGLFAVLPALGWDLDKDHFISQSATNAPEYPSPGIYGWQRSLCGDGVALSVVLLGETETQAALDHYDDESPFYVAYFTEAARSPASYGTPYRYYGVSYWDTDTSTAQFRGWSVDADGGDFTEHLSSTWNPLTDQRPFMIVIDGSPTEGRAWLDDLWDGVTDNMPYIEYDVDEVTYLYGMTDITWSEDLQKFLASFLYQLYDPFGGTQIWDYLVAEFPAGALEHENLVGRADCFIYKCKQMWASVDGIGFFGSNLDARFGGLTFPRWAFPIPGGMPTPLDPVASGHVPGDPQEPTCDDLSDEADIDSATIIVGSTRRTIDEALKSCGAPLTDVSGGLWQTYSYLNGTYPASWSAVTQTVYCITESHTSTSSPNFYKELASYSPDETDLADLWADPGILWRSSVNDESGGTGHRVDYYAAAIAVETACSDGYITLTSFRVLLHGFLFYYDGAAFETEPDGYVDPFCESFTFEEAVTLAPASAGGMSGGQFASSLFSYDNCGTTEYVLISLIIGAVP